MRKWLVIAPLVFLSLSFLFLSQSMFWKKSYKAISEYPTDTWTLAEAGTKGQNYTLLRFNQGIKEAAGHPDYPVRVGVAVPVTSVQDSNAALDALEDAISEKLSKDESGVEVLTISSLDGNQFKEFVFYTKENVDFKTLHEDLEKAFPLLNIQFYAEKDPQWSVYKEYAR